MLVVIIIVTIIMMMVKYAYILITRLDTMPIVYMLSGLRLMGSMTILMIILTAFIKLVKKSTSAFIEGRIINCRSIGIIKQ